jgi:hypothetical protein
MNAGYWHRRAASLSAGWVACTLGLSGLAGCSQNNGPVAPTTQAAAGPAPMQDELPPAYRAERLGSARVGVEKRGVAPRLATVPAFEPVEPTPEEREILGPPPVDPLDDLMVFYPVPPGSHRGVFGSLGGASTGVEMSRYPGGARAMTSLDPGPGVGLDAHPMHGVLLRSGSIGAQAGTMRPLTGRRYSETGATVGENEAPRGAAREKRLYD